MSPSCIRRVIDECSDNFLTGTGVNASRSFAHLFVSTLPLLLLLVPMMMLLPLTLPPPAGEEEEIGGRAMLADDDDDYDAGGERT